MADLEKKLRGFDLYKFNVDKLLAMIEPDLPDLTPVNIDAAIKAFVPNLCCITNPVAIVYRHRVCQTCFERLRAQYTIDAWTLGGGTA